MDKEQCPNCGGYKTITKEKYSKEKRGKYASYLAKKDPLYLLSLVIIVIGLWLGFFEKNILGYYLGFLASIFGLLRGYYLRRKAIDQVVESFENICTQCGYKWTRKVGEPSQTVTVRSDL